MEQRGIRERLVGTWRLVSSRREEVATGRGEEQLGAEPRGFITYTPSGHVMALLTRGDQAPIGGDADRAAQHRAMVAYAGRYEVVGESVHHHVEVSWQPATVGTTFVRHVAFEGEDRLVLRSPPGPSAMDGLVSTITVTWRREG